MAKSADDPSERTPQHSEVKKYDCPGCGAELIFDAATQSLLCEYCDGTVAIQQTPSGECIVEHDLEQGLSGALERGLGTTVKTAQCDSCGAVVSFEQNLTSTECDFCGSRMVLDVDARRNLIRPESLVPFKVTADKARDLFRKWLGGLWFRPSDLKKRARAGDIRGVYLPYWTFDARVTSRWKALAGHYYYVRVRQPVVGKDGRRRMVEQQVRKVRWEPASGRRVDAHDDVLIAASRGVPTELLSRLLGFDTSALEPYSPQYLAGWKAEEYAVPLNDAWRNAVGRIEALQRAACASDVPGDTHAELQIDDQFEETTFKHVLLPVWIAAYNYKETLYQFLVSGQTGQIVGQAPWSAWKIFLAVVGGILLLGTLLYLSQ